MGLKMPEAFYSKENRRMTVDEAREKEITTDLYCISECCKVPLIYVTSFKRTYGDNKVSIVRDYFRLANNLTHDEKCKYNTEGRVKIIARDSDEILESINNGMYEFRMNLIAKSLNRLKQDQFDTDGKNSLVNNEDKPKGKEYVNNGKLKSYLSTMNKILILRSEIEENKELSSLIKLEFGTKSVGWNNFYYSDDDYVKCFNYVSRYNIKHPICIEGKINAIKEPTESFKYHSLELIKPWVGEVDKNGVKRIPSVTVAIFNESIANYIQAEIEKGNDHIAFYSFIIVKENEYGKKIKYLNVNGSIFHKKQVHIYSL